MKFGKYLASRQLELPEYAGHFIDYKALKKLIKQLAIPADGNESGGNSGKSSFEIHEILKENKASFFFRVERELDKVNMFYLEKQANLEMTLDLLLMKKKELYQKCNDISRNQSESVGIAALNSNLRNSITFLNLFQNFKRLHQDLTRLQQFIELNETGFLKVVKKWDKRSKSHTKEIFILTAVSVQPVFHKSEINELSDLVTQSLMDLEAILDGDYSSIFQISERISESQMQHTSQTGQEVRRTSVNGNVVKKTDEEGNGPLNSIPAMGFQAHRIPSILNLNNEIDELYVGFINVATLKDPDFSLLARWVDKLKSSSKPANNLSTVYDESARYKLSKIFMLAISNLKISDSFLITFLKFVNFQVDFSFISDDSKRNILHECCSIPTASTSSHVLINNGIKVISSSDSISHSRNEIVVYVMQNLDSNSRRRTLIEKDFNGRNCLHYAAQNNRLDLIDIVSQDFPKEHIGDLDNESMSALLLAIKHKNFEVIKKLIKLGSECFPRFDESKLQYLPINYACKIGGYKILEYLLLNSRPDHNLINQQDVEGLLPLHVISRSGNYKLINLLIQYGADVNMFDGLNKWPPIFYAALEGHVKTTQELIKFGAKLDLVDENGYNVLYYCVVEGHIPVLNELLKYHNNICKSAEDMPHSVTDMDVEGNHYANDSPQNSMRGSLIHGDDESCDSGRLEESSGSCIPDLQLPPPVLPLRRYGHNFLEQKVLIELILPKDFNIIQLYDSAADMKPGRITVTSNITDIVPRNILLPISADKHFHSNCIFQTDIDSLSDFKIDFEIFPTFGTRLIAKTTAAEFYQTDLPNLEIKSVILPLFDLRLRNIGELRIKYHVVFPFSGILLEASKFDTYWKSSTKLIKSPVLKHNAAGGLSPNNLISGLNGGGFGGNGGTTNTKTHLHEHMQKTNSFVTATSLTGDYLRIRVCMLNDGTPIVCPQWSIAISDLINLYVPNLSLQQLDSITGGLFDYEKALLDLSRMSSKDLPLIKKLLLILYVPLQVFLDCLSVDINLNLEIVYPSPYEFKYLPFVEKILQNLNKFVDLILNDIFNHVRSQKVDNVNGHGRSIIFASSNSLICKMLNWKQPNYPVFLSMDGIVYNAGERIFEHRSSNGLLEFPPELDSKSIDSDESIQETLARSIKEAVNFAINNNLIGIIIPIHLLNLAPKLIPLIRAAGLVLVASHDINANNINDASREILECYIKSEINGIRMNDVLAFKDEVSM